MGDRLADALESAGGTCSRVRIGTASLRLSKDEWALDPASVTLSLPEPVGWIPELVEVVDEVELDVDSVVCTEPTG